MEVRIKVSNGKFPHKICTGAIQLTRPTAIKETSHRSGRVHERLKTEVSSPCGFYQDGNFQKFSKRITNLNNTLSLEYILRNIILQSTEFANKELSEPFPYFTKCGTTKR